MPEAHEEILQHADDERDDGGAEDGARHERLAHYLEGEAEQEKIADILGHGHGDEPVGAEIDERADTRKTADDYLVGKDEGCESYAVEQKPHDNHYVVFRIIEQCFMDIHG